MSEKKIIVEIDSNGNVNAETFGMEGVGCVEELSKLMKDLATVTADEKKPDYYQNKTSTNNTIKVKK